MKKSVFIYFFKNRTKQITRKQKLTRTLNHTVFKLIQTESPLNYYKLQLKTKIALIQHNSLVDKPKRNQLKIKT